MSSGTLREVWLLVFDGHMRLLVPGEGHFRTAPYNLIRSDGWKARLYACEDLTPLPPAVSCTARTVAQLTPLDRMRVANPSNLLGWPASMGANAAGASR